MKMNSLTNLKFDYRNSNQAAQFSFKDKNKKYVYDFYLYDNGFTQDAYDYFYYLFHITPLI